MKDKLRGFLGFLGLVEDDYGDYGTNGSPRPFSEQPEQFEPEWSAPPTLAPRPVPVSQPSASPYRAPAPAPSPERDRAVRPTSPMRRGTTSSISVLEGEGARIRPIASPNAPRTTTRFVAERDVAVVAPDSYDDSRRITDYLRSNRPVVLTTLDIDHGLARRLVDFTAGTAYALGAKIEMLVRGVYLISPNGVQVGPEVKERLRDTNYHSWDHA